MHRIPFLRRPGPLIPPNENETTSGEPIGPECFYPSLFDVLKVRYILQWKIVPQALPIEIVDLIVDAAEYWPSIERAMGKETIIRQDFDREIVRSAPLCYDEKTLATSSSPKPLPHRTIHPCRKIVFQISSHDQGWGGGYGRRGRYEGSYTWFDTTVIHAAHEKSRETDNSSAPDDGRQDDPSNDQEQQRMHFGPDDPLLLPRADKLQCNPVSVGTTQHFTITWHHLDDIKADSTEAEEIESSQGRGRATLDGHVVRELEIGDSIAVWARARFGGWVNHVERASVRVFWAV